MNIDDYVKKRIPKNTERLLDLLKNVEQPRIKVEHYMKNGTGSMTEVNFSLNFYDIDEQEEYASITVGITEPLPTEDENLTLRGVEFLTPESRLYADAGLAYIVFLLKGNVKIVGDIERTPNERLLDSIGILRKAEQQGIDYKNHQVVTYEGTTF